MVISRSTFAENGKEMYRNEKKHAKGMRAKLLFLVIKYAKFMALLLSARRRSPHNLTNATHTLY